MLDDVSRALQWLVDQGDGVRLHAAADAPEGRTLRAADGTGAERVVRVLAAPPGARGIALDTGAVARAGARSLENVLNHVAHDIRNLAFTAGLQAEMGARKTGDTPEIRAHFEAVLAQVDALKAYLERLLLIGRPVRLTVAEVDVASLLARVAAEAQQVRAPGGPPLPLAVEARAAGTARWDPRAVGLAVGAAVDNALESRNPAPPTVIGARADGDRILVTVRDEGPGIAPELIPVLGTPMAARRPGAAGLGLAIARKMAHAHGGRVEVDSSPSGTTVTFVLPREVSGG